MTEATWCIYTLICPLTGPAINHSPGNGVGHLWIVKRPYDHIISLVIRHHACEQWLIATEPYDRVPTLLRLWRWQISLNCEMLSSSDTFWVLLTRFATQAWSTILESVSLSLHDFAALMAGAVKYTNFISEEGQDPPPTSVLDMTLNNLIVRLQSLGNAEYLFIAIALRSTLAQSGSTWTVWYLNLVQTNK